MLYTKIQPKLSPRFWKRTKDSAVKLSWFWERRLFTIYGHGGHLNEQAITISINFQSPLTEGSTRNLKKIRPEVSEEKSFKSKDGSMDRRWTASDGRQVITIVHPEPLAQIS